MIAYLQGKILQKTLTFIILEHQGIGYKVFVTPEVLEHAIGDDISVYTYLKSGDDGQSLFGLPDFEHLQFFELLISVSGVGPKGALGILSAAKLDTITHAIANQDADIFTRMSGVGKKTAERIILELRNKVGTLGLSANTGRSDVFDGLLALGYSQREVRDIVSKLDTALSPEEQLKQALKLLAK
jgi:holliday junction DNA helicase RuvA